MSANLLKVAREVYSSISEPKLTKLAAAEKDADWQRVNSLLADILKDMTMVYAKLARLQGDFAAEELSKLEEVSEHVMSVAELFSGFLKDFHKGGVNMAAHKQYGDTGGAPLPAVPGAAPPAPAPEAPPAPAPEAGSDESFDKELEDEDEYEFEGFEDEEDESEEKPEKEDSEED